MNSQGMIYPLRLLGSALLICAAGLGASAALGQSLSIVKQSESNYWIQASAPADNPHALQASGNLHLWTNLQDSVQGQYSYHFAISGTAQRYFRLTPSTDAKPINVMLLGDSMTSDCCGWGGGMTNYFKPNATIINYAQAGVSSRSFLRSAELDKMLIVKPDYVLIQYGYMDQAWGADLAPDTYTTPAEFADNLRTLVNMVRGFNGVPILVTIHSARVWDATGKVIPTWQERNAVTKQVAAELQVFLIDLNQLSLELFNKLGPTCEQWMHVPGFSDSDVMHLSHLGGQYVAQLVVNALPDSFGPYLTGNLDPPPKP